MQSSIKVILFLIVSSLCACNCFSQNESLNSKRDLAVNGIILTENTSLTVRQNRFSNFELSLIEVPILLKTNLNDKFSVLVGGKLDFYRNNIGFSKDIGVSTSFGFQYDASPNTYVQGLFSYRVKGVNNIYHYNNGSKLSFMLNAGFKF